MKRQITVYDGNHNTIGTTYQRRAKQLIAKHKALWLDEEQTQIALVQEKEEGVKMSVDSLNFEQGPLEQAPANSAVSNAADADGLFERKRFERKKSLIKDVYRDEMDVIISSTPMEIIQKSKKHTRELHLAFSAVLWSGTIIVFTVLNLLLGYTKLTFRVSEISWTWLVFVLAALIECTVEILFSTKELDVLNENIDFRQYNPSKPSVIELLGYQKKLMFKIRAMTSALLWIPLVILYFVSGYAFGLWRVAWVLFLFGVFFELLYNFLKKLKISRDR